MTHTMVVGTSEPQDFQLLDDGAPLVGTGFTVELEWRGTPPLSPALTVAWLSQAAGTVRVSDVENLPTGTYRFRWVLTDGLGAVGYVPNKDPADTWRVTRV